MFSSRCFFPRGTKPSPHNPTISVVTPWQRSNSCPGFFNRSKSAWEWESIRPGDTTFPPASITSSAISSKKGPPTFAIRSPFTRTSPEKAGVPFPSMIRPFLINKEYSLFILIQPPFRKRYRSCLKLCSRSLSAYKFYRLYTLPLFCYTCIVEASVLTSKECRC